MLTICVLVACVAWLPPGTAQQPDASALAITHGPYLQLPTGTSMTIVWHTNRPCVSRVEYGPDERLGSTAVGSEHGLIDNDRTSHVVRLTGLTPGRTYRYRVVSREFQGYEKQHIVKFGATVSSEMSSFTTLDEKKASYSFAVVSDIHENAKRLDGMLAAVDWSLAPLAIFNGDMVNDFMNPDQPFTGFLDVAVARFARTIPFVYVRGNHDVRGRFARRLADYFPMRDGHAYYSFDHGPVHFIVLDSGEDKVDAHEYYNGLVAFEPYRREQAIWLAGDLRSPAARRARYRIVVSHIPPHDGTAREGTADEGFAIQQVRECWEKAANAGAVDLWLSGHTHRYAHVAPAARTNRYHLVIGAPDTLTRVDVSSQKLLVTITRETGGIVETVTVRPRVGGAGL
jgi:predicted phosphodiesterase